MEKESYDNVTAVPSRLKKLRLDRRLGQADIANVLGVSPSHMSMIESGKRSLSTPQIQTLAKYYGISYDYLFGEIDDPTPWTKLGEEDRQSYEKYKDDLMLLVNFLKLHDGKPESMRDATQYMHLLLSQESK